MSANRILMVEANEDGTAGGSHQSQFDLARSLDRTRYEPVVLFYQQNRYADMLRALGIEVHVWEAERTREGPSLPPFRRVKQVGRWLGAVARRARFLRRVRIDLVHLNNSPGVGYHDWLPAAKLTGRPCIVHAQMYFGQPTRILWRWLVRHFDRYIAISRTVADYLADRRGIPPGRIATVYHATDCDGLPAKVRRTPAEVRAELGVTNGRALVTMVGHLRDWKGQDVVLDALARLEPAARSRLRVVFAGGPGPGAAPYIERLQETVRREQLADCVTFLGERSDAIDLMNAADIVLHASTIAEPFGIVVIEGMALGKPVVASRLGGPGEIVTPGTGILFDPKRPEELAQTLRGLLDDPARREALGAAARERVRAFGLRQNVEGVERVYADCFR